MDTQAPEYDTFFDQRPTHRPVPAFVTAAVKHYEQAQAEYDTYVDLVYSGHYPGSIDYNKLDALARAVDDTYHAMLDAKDRQYDDMPTADEVLGHWRS